MQLAIAREYGSSPRVWGTLNVPLSRCVFTRFIPACVGNSYKHDMDLQSHPVHPRVCGELSVLTTSVSFSIGSSPRVWGTLWLGRHRMG